MKRQTADLEKLQNHISNKGLTFRNRKHPQNSVVKNKKQKGSPVRKWVKEKKITCSIFLPNALYGSCNILFPLICSHQRDGWEHTCHKWVLARMHFPHSPHVEWPKAAQENSTYSGTQKVVSKAFASLYSRPALLTSYYPESLCISDTPIKLISPFNIFPLLSIFLRILFIYLRESERK